MIRRRTPVAVRRYPAGEPTDRLYDEHQILSEANYSYSRMSDERDSRVDAARSVHRLGYGGGADLIYRSMKIATDGHAACGASARALGARAGTDIPTDADGVVHPGTGGMSVSPGAPENLPPHRRPPAFGGVGKDAVFELEPSVLGDSLYLRLDPENPEKHGFVEPSAAVPMVAYQTALCSTRTNWQEVSR